MKNKMKLFGIIAIAALIGFSTAACDDGGGNSGGGAASLGETPKLSGKVYVEKWVEDEEYHFPTFAGYEAYTGGNLTVSEGDFEGEIKNGQLSITLGTPKSGYLESAGNIGRDYFFSYTYWEDIEISPSSAKYYIIDRFWVDSDDGSYNELCRLNTTFNSYEEVRYFYVDRDCVLSGERHTDTDSGITYSYNSFNLALKAGWNAVYWKDSTSGNTSTVTMSLSNPGSVKWVMR